MTTNTVDRVIALAVKRFKHPGGDVPASADIFETLKIDSFQAVELMSELELEFDVEIPDYELQGVRTFAELAQKIDERR